MSVRVRVWGVALLLALRSTARSAETGLTPGAESAVDLAGGGRMQIFLPSAYDPTRAWPVVFFYHGQGGQPTTAPLRRFAGDREFIVVGMPYLEPEPKQRTSAEQDLYCRREIENLRRARDWVERQARVDAGRVFLGGLSMGGWTASMLGERELPQLAGLVILLAGRVRTAAPPPASFGGKPVYIGAGDTDANLHAARRAAALYRHLGAKVTFEEFAGVGHALPAEAPALTAWLETQGRLRSAGEAARKELDDWFAERLRAAVAETEPVKRYLGLRALWDDPRFPLCSPACETRLRQALPPVMAAPSVQTERSAEETLDRLLVADQQVKRLDDLKAVRDGLLRLADTAPDTRAGRIAAQEFRWVDEAWSKSLAASRVTAASPSSPSAPTNTAGRTGLSSGTRGGFPMPEYERGRIRFRR